MTIREFCEVTGWPLESFLELTVAEAVLIAAWYGLRFEVVKLEAR